MVRRGFAAWMWLWASLLALPAAAEALSGLCPDGSIFIVQRAADIPCKRAKLVDPAELPPLRPELLPRPYTWMVDQEARDPNNPYNLIDAAQRLRDLRRGEGGVGVEPLEGGEPAAGRATPVRLEEAELRDLARIVVLRQRLAPAALAVDDLRGPARLVIELAHSPAFEERIREAARLDDGLVIAFLARAAEAAEFWPNFLVVQGARTFRPDAARSGELGILLGQAGEQSRGALVLGYFVLPAGRFDPTQAMDLWWNDRSVRATLQP